MPKTYKVQGLWKGRSAGGCVNHATWRYNPQLFLRVPEQKSVKITVTQARDVDFFYIGLYVVSVANGEIKRQLQLTTDSIVGKAQFECAKSIILSVLLEADKLYCVIPCTFQPNQEDKFTIAFTSDGDIKLSPLPPQAEYKFVSVEGEWKGRSAGGCRNHVTCSNNPQFLVEVQHPTRAYILVSQANNPDFDFIGVYVIETTDSVNKIPSLAAVPPEYFAGKSDFSRPTEADIFVDLVPGRLYSILPCTFEPGSEAPFTLTLYSDHDVSLRMLRDPQEITTKGEWRGNSAGGCINFPSWRMNPQFFLLSSTPVQLLVTLTRTGGDEAEPMGFYVCRTKGHRVVVLNPTDLVGKGGFEHSNTVTCNVTLDQVEHPYMIIPCLFSPQKEATFVITVNYVGKRVESGEVKLLPCNYMWAKKSLKGEWKGASAGGCRNCIATWLNNPQLTVKVESSCNVVVILSQPASDTADKSIGFYIINTPRPGRVSSVGGNDVVGKSAFQNIDEIFIEMHLEPGLYNILPCTFEAGQEGEFSISVYADSDNFELLATDGNFKALHSGDPFVAGGMKALSISKPAASDEGQEDSLPPEQTVKWEDVKLDVKIGQGGFGIVYRGFWNGREVAVKRCFNDDLSAEDYDSFLKEVQIMSKLKHKNVLEFLGASLTDNICILTEFMAKGNLRNVLQYEPNVPWRTKIKMAVDAAEGMHYLHSIKPPVVHRDLKSLNLLVAQDYTVKVSDFGLSKVTSGFSLNSKVGSLNWCAPEVLLKSSPYTSKGDVYSYGMVLWELLSHQPPFFNMHPLQIVRSIDKGELPTIPAGTPPNFERLIQDCWNSEPKFRPDFNIILVRLKEFVAGEGFPPPPMGGVSVSA